MKILILIGLIVLYLLIGMFIEVLIDRLFNIEIGALLWFFWPTMIIVAPLVLLCAVFITIGETIRDKINDLFDCIINAFRK